MTRHCGGAHLRVQRVRGDTRTEYVVQVQPYQPWRMPRVFALTRAQRTICRYLVEGATMAETARALDRSVDTVRSHVRRIYAHLDVGSRAELCTYVMNREPAPWAPNPRAP